MHGAQRVLLSYYVSYQHWVAVNKLLLNTSLLVVLSVYASKGDVLLLLCLVQPPVTTDSQPTKSLHLPQSLSSELSSQSLSWSQTQRSGMQRRFPQRNSLSVQERGAEGRTQATQGVESTKLLFCKKYTTH